MRPKARTRPGRVARLNALHDKLVEAKVEEDVFLDALLSIGLALSRGSCGRDEIGSFRIMIGGGGGGHGYTRGHCSAGVDFVRARQF